MTLIKPFRLPRVALVLWIVSLVLLAFFVVNESPVLLGKSLWGENFACRASWYRDNVTRSEQRRKSPSGNKAWEPGSVLLFAYPRSGSSFTGDVIQHSPDVYYVFEPLRQIYLRDEDSAESQAANSMEVLQELFGCNFSFSLLQRIERPFLNKSQASSTLWRCSEYLPRPQSSPFLRCLEDAKQVCRSHKRLVIKTIRYSMTWAEKLTKVIPDLAVIFLLRDPRASLWSRINVFGSPSNDSLQSEAREYCVQMFEDLIKARELFSRDPRKIRFLRYEDIADEPILVSQKIYKFLQLSFSKNVKSRIVEQTRSGRRNQTNQTSKRYRKNARNVFTVKRQDSAKAASEWRVDIPLNISRTVEYMCSEVMTLAGYRSFQTLDALRQQNISSRGAFKFVEYLPFPNGDLSS